MVRPQGVLAVAVWHLILGSLLLLGSCTILFAAIPAALITNGDDAMGAMAPLVALGLGFSLSLGLGVLGLIIGWGLIQMKSWARWAAIVLNAFSLIAFPVGTVIGGLILWYLFQPEVVYHFGGERTM